MKNMQGVYKSIFESQRRFIHRFKNRFKKKKRKKREEALKKMSDEWNEIFQLIFVLYYMRDQSHWIITRILTSFLRKITQVTERRLTIRFKISSQMCWWSTWTWNGITVKSLSHPGLFWYFIPYSSRVSYNDLINESSCGINRKEFKIFSLKEVYESQVIASSSQNKVEHRLLCSLTWKGETEVHTSFFIHKPLKER